MKYPPNEMPVAIIDHVFLRERTNQRQSTSLLDDDEELCDMIVNNTNCYGDSGAALVFNVEDDVWSNSLRSSPDDYPDQLIDLYDAFTQHSQQDILDICCAPPKASPFPDFMDPTSAPSRKRPAPDQPYKKPAQPDITKLAAHNIFTDSDSGASEAFNLDLECPQQRSSSSGGSGMSTSACVCPSSRLSDTCTSPIKPAYRPAQHFQRVNPHTVPRPAQHFTSNMASSPAGRAIQPGPFSLAACLPSFQFDLGTETEAGSEDDCCEIAPKPAKRPRVVVPGSSPRNSGSADKKAEGPQAVAPKIRKLSQDILKFIGSLTGIVFEKQIRAEFGNNPDTSKALRILAGAGKLVRAGGGGRKQPFQYSFTDKGRAELKVLLGQ